MRVARSVRPRSSSFIGSGCVVALCRRGQRGEGSTGREFVPAHDAEPVLHREGELCWVDGPVRFHERDEAGDARVAGGHLVQQLGEDRRIGDAFGTRLHGMAAKPNRYRLVLAKVQLPLATPGGEQRVAVADVADRLAVRAARLAAGEGDQHQLAAERCREGKRQYSAHHDVDDAKEACPSPHAARRVDVGHNNFLCCAGCSLRSTGLQLDLERWSACELSTVDNQGGAGDKRRLVAAEPDDGVGDFVRLTDPPQRHGSGGGLLCLLSGAAQVVGEARAGGDDVDADVVCGVVEGGDLGDAFEPVLGGDVGGEPTDALQTGRGGHVTMAPPPFLTMAGSSYFMARKTPRRLTASPESNASTGTSASGVGGCPAPAALLQAKSSPPNSSSTASTMLATARF